LLRLPVGHESKMPDADEAGRQDMQKEAPQKLLDAKLWCSINAF